MSGSDETTNATTTTEILKNLITKATTDGHERYLKTRKTHQVERLNVEMGIIEGALDPCVVETMKLAKAAQKKRRGRPKMGLKQVVSVEPTASAFLGLQTCWESVGTKARLQQRAVTLGARLEQHALRAFAKERLGATQAKKLWKTTESKFSNKDIWLEDKTNEYGGRSINPRDQSLKAKLAKRGHRWPEWGEDIRAAAGLIVYGIVLDNTNLFIEEPVIKRRGMMQNPKGSGKVPRFSTDNILTLTDAAEQARREGIEKAEWMMPVFPVLTEKPVEWGTWNNAPYPDPDLSSMIQFVRKMGRDQRKAVFAALRDGTMPKVVEAVNTLQNVGFVVNHDVYEAVQWCMANKLEPDDSFPPQRKIPIKPFVAANDNGDDDELNKARQLHAVKKRDAMARNRAMKSSVVLNGYIADTIKMLKSSTFYMPHNLDFRSRIYPISVFNHYGADYIKALFYFADAKPLGERGVMWLFVAAATYFDAEDEHGERLSKKSVQDRYDWTEDNFDRIARIGLDYQQHYWHGDGEPDDLYWNKADKPFMFLAVCIELLKLWRHKERYGNLEMLSGLPVSIDGACSGYQHYSAAMRAKFEGSLVNLTPSERPNDIYKFIADKVTEVVKLDADGDGEKKALAQLWLKNGITRKVVKRPVMTSGYNSNAYGFTDQIMADLMDKLFVKVLAGKLDKHPFAHEGDLKGFKAAKYLASIIKSQIGVHLSAADMGMEFFKDCVNLCSAKGVHFNMKSPLGFPFYQNYRRFDHLQITPAMFSRGVWKRVQLTLQKPENDNEPEDGEAVRVTVDKDAPVHNTESRNAISANLTHMADATHMQMVICAAKKQGIGNLMMIHDSFGTTAAEMDQLFAIVREEFVSLYQHYDPFQAVADATEDLINQKDGKPISMFALDEDGGIIEDEYGKEVLNDEYTYIMPLDPLNTLDIEEVNDSWYCFMC